MARPDIEGIFHPSTEAVRQRLAEFGLEVSDACAEGVAANLVVLRNHRVTLNDLEEEQHWPSPVHGVSS